MEHIEKLTLMGESNAARISEFVMEYSVKLIADMDAALKNKVGKLDPRFFPNDDTIRNIMKRALMAARYHKVCAYIHHYSHAHTSAFTYTSRLTKRV